MLAPRRKVKSDFFRRFFCYLLYPENHILTPPIARVSPRRKIPGATPGKTNADHHERSNQEDENQKIQYFPNQSQTDWGVETSNFALFLYKLRLYSFLIFLEHKKWGGAAEAKVGVWHLSQVLRRAPVSRMLAIASLWLYRIFTWCSARFDVYWTSGHFLMNRSWKVCTFVST